VLNERCYAREPLVHFHRPGVVSSGHPRFAHVVLTGSGDFKARLTWVNLRRLRLVRVEENLARIAFVRLTRGPIFVSFGGIMPVRKGYMPVKKALRPEVQLCMATWRHRPPRNNKRSPISSSSWVMRSCRAARPTCAPARRPLPSS
jgi:hypothetical protein